MEEPFFEGLRSLERQAFVKYVAVADQNGFPVTASGDATKSTPSEIREVMNCAHEIFPGAKDIKIVVEGETTTVAIGEDSPFTVGVLVDKELF